MLMFPRSPPFLAALTLLAGCSIKQHVLPVDKIDESGQICIVENEAVRPGFARQLLKVLGDRGYVPRMLPQGSDTRSCPTVATYEARWTWDLTIYMAYAKISVYHEGEVAGEAVYDATKGGARLDKFIDAEPKIRELVEQLFPVEGRQTAPPTAGKQSSD